MATETVNQSPADCADQDLIDENAKKLSALLNHTIGESGESFRNLSGEIQDDYLWACSDMAKQVVRSLEAIQGRKLARDKAARGKA